jgi:glycosidase
VANHTGPYHPWVKDPPSPDWFHGTPASHPDEDWQTWTIMDRYATPAARRLTLDGWFLNILPDLNHENSEVRRYIIQNAIWWVGVTGLDGIRQDTLPYAPRKFWAECRAALAREFPALTVVGEVLDGNPAMVAFFQGGVRRHDGIDSRIESLFDFPLYYAMRSSFARGDRIRDVAKVIAHDWLYHDPSKLVTLAGLHDVNRFMHERGATIDGLKLAFSFLFTARGIPLIYYGDEIAMRGGNDPDNRRDFPGGWRTDKRNAFEPSGRSAEQQSAWYHVQSLARIRRDSEALRRGEMILLHHSEQTLVYARRSGREFVLTTFNNATLPASLEVDVRQAGLKDGAELHPVLGTKVPVLVEGGTVRLTVSGRSSAIYRALR